MKNKFVLFALGFLLLAVLLSGCATGMTPSSWPGIQADGESAYVASANHVYAVNLENGSERWRFPEKVDAKKTFYAAPTLSSDGQLLVSSYDKILYSLDPKDGSLNWTFEGSKDHLIGSAVESEGMIFVPSADYNLYALNLEGKLQWTFSADGALWSQPVVKDGRVYFGSLDHNVYALNAANGKLVWKAELNGAILGSVTLTEDGSLYAGTQGGKVYAISVSSGDIQWEHEAASWIWSGPVVWDGSLFMGDQSGKFVSLLAEDGAENWSIQPDGPVLGSALVLPDGVLFGTESGSLVAVDMEGTTLWNQTVTGKLYGTPVLAVETILVGPVEGDAILIAFDLKGTQRWVFTPAK